MAYIPNGMRCWDQPRPSAWLRSVARRCRSGMRLARQVVALEASVMSARRWHARTLQVLTEQGADPAELVHHAGGACDLDAVAIHAPIAAKAAHAAESCREAIEHYAGAVALEAGVEAALQAGDRLSALEGLMTAANA
jgi:hypothetical protein